MSVIAFAASISFAFLRNPKKHIPENETKVLPENENLINLSENLRESAVASAIVVIDKTNKKRGFWNDVNRVWTLMISKRMLLFLP